MRIVSISYEYEGVVSGGGVGDLLPDFRTDDKLRDWLPALRPNIGSPEVDFSGLLTVAGWLRQRD